LKTVNFKQLEKIMKEQGRKQSWLGTVIGESPMQVNHYFRGRRNMPFTYIPLIAKALGVPANRFLN